MTRSEPPHRECPACSTPLSAETWAWGLCVRCLAELAKRDPDADAECAQGGSPPTAGEGLAPGVVLGSRYRLRARLGSGGMGEVWWAVDLKLRMDVALKSLRPELAADPEALAALHREVRLAREVVSPNVCRVFDLQEVAGREWISMEHIDGVSLAEILADRGPLEHEEACDLAAQLLAGIEAIHGAGLLHLDIKPENLMVTRTGRLVVMDFGISGDLETGRSGRIAGTPAYMSPEQWRAEALDARADVYSAGVVLAEMTAPAVAGAPWAEVIARAVARDRERRFASASALAQALEEATTRAAHAAVELPGFQCACRVELLDGRRLGGRGDSDRIRMRDVAPTANAAQIEFELMVAPAHRERAVMLFETDKLDRGTEVVKVHGGKTGAGVIAASLLETHHLVLGKSREPGELRPVYHLTEARASLQPGRKYRIDWLGG